MMFSLTPRFDNNLFDDMDKYFNRGWDFFRRETANPMRTDVEEKDGNYELTIDMPGFDKDDIKAELKDGYLTVSAEKKDDKEDKNDNGYVMRERYSGACSRTFYVGDHVTENDIKAAFRNGTLKLTFPKEAEKKVPESKLISIE